jgi:hypothetical protein
VTGLRGSHVDLLLIRQTSRSIRMDEQMYVEYHRDASTRSSGCISFLYIFTTIYNYLQLFTTTPAAISTGSFMHFFLYLFASKSFITFQARVGLVANHVSGGDRSAAVRCVSCVSIQYRGSAQAGFDGPGCIPLLEVTTLGREGCCHE